MTEIPAPQEHLLISYQYFRGRQPDLVPCHFPADFTGGKSGISGDGEGQVAEKLAATARGAAVAAARACLSAYMRASA